MATSHRLPQFYAQELRLPRLLHLRPSVRVPSRYIARIESSSSFGHFRSPSTPSPFCAPKLSTSLRALLDPETVGDPQFDYVTDDPSFLPEQPDVGVQEPEDPEDGSARSSALRSS
ncbi:uncharacterized protein [Triticum aestivum]|uniref:uncharacterized protein n=1 Tax=Triticum aestivum TaxID=4565 RepID=UPI001D00D946|nr:uncharacterized protein LOC123065848 [Triticum aestivum]